MRLPNSIFPFSHKFPDIVRIQFYTDRPFRISLDIILHRRATDSTNSQSNGIDTPRYGHTLKEENIYNREYIISATMLLKRKSYLSQH